MRQILLLTSFPILLVKFLLRHRTGFGFILRIRVEAVSPDNYNSDQIVEILSSSKNAILSGLSLQQQQKPNTWELSGLFSDLLYSLLAYTDDSKEHIFITKKYCRDEISFEPRNHENSDDKENHSELTINLCEKVLVPLTVICIT